MADINTKEKILETALKLFNDKGSYAVTTRHIAAEMGISPGNLYYHYRNKEEIIRVLLERMFEEFNLFIRTFNRASEPAAAFSEMINRTGHVVYRFRFFYMEIYTLLEKDPVLKKRYMKIKEERVSDFRKIFRHMEQGGMMSAIIPEDEFFVLLENAWALSEFMLQSMYLNRIRITPENIINKFSGVMHLIRPYLKPWFRTIIK